MQKYKQDSLPLTILGNFDEGLSLFPIFLCCHSRPVLASGKGGTFFLTDHFASPLWLVLLVGRMVRGRGGAGNSVQIGASYIRGWKRVTWVSTYLFGGRGRGWCECPTCLAGAEEGWHESLPTWLEEGAGVVRVPYLPGWEQERDGVGPYLIGYGWGRTPPPLPEQNETPVKTCFVLSVTIIYFLY